MEVLFTSGMAVDAESALQCTFTCNEAEILMDFLISLDCT
jgi:hypothetical protein